MEIDGKQNGTELTIILSGRMTVETSRELDAYISAQMVGITSLIIDLADVDYVSSSGLRALLSAQIRMGRQGKMVVKHVRPVVMDVFKMTGFDKVLTIE